MRRVGQTRKRDANEPAIVDALERAGCVVFRLSGKGVPDLLVHRRGRWMPLEVKRHHGKLTPAQQETAQLVVIPVVCDPEDALGYVRKYL